MKPLNFERWFIFLVQLSLILEKVEITDDVVQSHVDVFQ